MPPCLLLPIMPVSQGDAFVWVLVWPSPNLRTHLEHWEHLEPKACFITTPSKRGDEEHASCWMSLLSMASMEPALITALEAEQLATHCSIKGVRCLLSIDRDAHTAYAVAQTRDGRQHSPQFDLDLLNLLSPPL